MITLKTLIPGSLRAARNLRSQRCLKDRSTIDEKPTSLLSEMTRTLVPNPSTWPWLNTKTRCIWRATNFSPLQQLPTQSSSRQLWAWSQVQTGTCSLTPVLWSARFASSTKTSFSHTAPLSTSWLNNSWSLRILCVQVFPKSLYSQ